MEEFFYTWVKLKNSKNEENEIWIESQQKALKLFMNVMYGYTSAGWTGKMPCWEIGDAVVGTAKTILY